MSKARLLLIRPNSLIKISPPPLGLLYIASYLREKSDEYDINILDARIKDLSLNQIRDCVKKYNPEYVGITGLHVDSAELHEIAKLVKNTVKDCSVIAGGPYPTGDYKRALKDINIDFCVVGEGEVTFFELMKALENETDLKSVKGLAFRNSSDVLYTGPRDFIEDLDKIPHPAWDLIDLNDYFYGKKRSLENPVQIYKKAISIISSRGCPFGCIYCHNIFGKKFRARSPKNTVSEIEYLIENYKIKEIEFLDDTFNFDMKRAKEICTLLAEKKIKLPICFSNGIRADRIDEELIVKLKEAGTYRINYGIESAVPRIQKIMGKALDLDSAGEVIEKTVKHKILCGAFFILGFPTETEEEMLKTIDFASRSKLHTAVFAIMTPFPGTKLYAQTNALYPDRDTSFSTVGKISINTSAVSKEKLAALRILAYQRFYFNPVRWWHIFVRVPRKLSIYRNFLEVMKVAFFKKELYA